MGCPCPFGVLFVVHSVNISKLHSQYGFIARCMLLLTKWDKTIIMRTLQERFEELSDRIKISGKPAAEWFPKYTATFLQDMDRLKEIISN